MHSRVSLLETSTVMYCLIQDSCYRQLFQRLNDMYIFRSDLLIYSYFEAVNVLSHKISVYRTESSTEMAKQFSL
jgi:hypothetical protein